MSRTKLSEALHELCENVYFQPPENVRMKYPCIVYTIRSGDSQYADDGAYIFKYSYDVTYIDSNPDSDVPRQIALKLPLCRMDRHYTANNLHHYTFIIYA